MQDQVPKNLDLLDLKKIISSFAKRKTMFQGNQNQSQDDFEEEVKSPKKTNTSFGMGINKHQFTNVAQFDSNPMKMMLSPMYVPKTPAIGLRSKKLQEDNALGKQITFIASRRKNTKHAPLSPNSAALVHGQGRIIRQMEGPLISKQDSMRSMSSYNNTIANVAGPVSMQTPNSPLMTHTSAVFNPTIAEIIENKDQFNKTMLKVMVNVKHNKKHHKNAALRKNTFLKKQNVFQMHSRQGSLNPMNRKSSNLQDTDQESLPEEMLEENLGYLVEGSIPSCGIISPDNTVKGFWDLAILLCVVYQAFVVPFRICFNLESSTDVFDTILDIMFIVDIVINFNTGFTRKGMVIMNRTKVTVDYLKTWFIFDVIASFPYNYLVTVNDTSNSTALQTPQLLRLLKVFRFLRILKVLRVIKMRKLLAKYEDYLQNDSIFLIKHFLKIILLIYFFVHCLACFFFGIGYSTIDAYEEGWIKSSGIVDESVWVQYNECLYWAFTTMITVGYGDIHPMNTIERIFGMFAIMISAGVYAYTLNNISKLVQQQNKLADDFREQMTYVNQFMTLKKLPKDIRFKVKGFLENQWEIKKVQKIEFQEIFELLNRDLTTRIILHINGRHINNLGFYNDLPLEFMTQLAFTMHQVTYNYDDSIFFEGEYGDKIFFVMGGKVAMLHKETHTYMEDLVTDEYFGEIEFFSEGRRILTAYSRDFTDLLYISRENYFDLALHNQDAEVFYAQAHYHIIDDEDYQLLGIECYICHAKDHIALTCPKFYRRRANLLYLQAKLDGVPRHKIDVQHLFNNGGKTDFKHKTTLESFQSESLSGSENEVKQSIDLSDSQSEDSTIQRKELDIKKINHQRGQNLAVMKNSIHSKSENKVHKNDKPMLQINVTQFDSSPSNKSSKQSFQYEDRIGKKSRSKKSQEIDTTNADTHIAAKTKLPRLSTKAKIQQTKFKAMEKLRDSNIIQEVDEEDERTRKMSPTKVVDFGSHILDIEAIHEERKSDEEESFNSEDAKPIPTFESESKTKDVLIQENNPISEETQEQIDPIEVHNNLVEQLKQSEDKEGNNPIEEQSEKHNSDESSELDDSYFDRLEKEVEEEAQREWDEEPHLFYAEQGYDSEVENMLLEEFEHSMDSELREQYQLQAVFKSKKEIYQFLTLQAEAYLPPFEGVTIYYLKDIMRGEKKFLFANEIKPIAVPHYKGLTVRDILNYYKLNGGDMQYMPEEKEQAHVPRSWICTVVNSIMYPDFKNWVNLVVDERKSRVMEKQNLGVEMDPKIASLIESSCMISSKSSQLQYQLNLTEQYIYSKSKLDTGEQQLKQKKKRKKKSQITSK